jgi:hypothetical protein
VQRCERPLQSGRIESLPTGTNLDGAQRAGEPAASPSAEQRQEQQRAGHAGQQQRSGEEEQVRLR